jgi:WD40 repeat protein
LKDSSKTLMKFSEDGKMFAYYDIDNQTIRIIDIDNNIEDLINKIKNQKFNTNFVGKSENCDIKFIEHIEFDTNSKYFVGYGDQDVFILDIITKEKFLYRINTSIYDKIYTIRFVSDKKDSKKF